MNRAALICASVVLVTASVFAQTAPNFAGKWTLVADPNAPAGGMGGLGQSATVVQDATSLTITRTTQMGEIATTYKLDGSESKNTVNMGGNSIDMLSKVKSEAGKLIVNTSMSFDGNPVETSMTLSLDAAGNLVVESTRPDFQGGGAPITTKMTYKKS
ncbi:MAG: hypothetical protein ABJC89_08115 [Acidobacteriota bacterium]